MVMTWADMTPAQRARLPDAVRARLYHRDYYLRNRKRRKRQRKARWQNDPKFRKTQLKQMKLVRGEKRKTEAIIKLAARIAKKASAARPQRHPRLADVNGRRELVYTTGAVALRAGREPLTIRDWIADRVLPGVSIVIGNKGWFTQGYIDAVFAALRRCVMEDARTPRDLMHKYTREALREAGEKWVPFVPIRRKIRA